MAVDTSMDMSGTRAEVEILRSESEGAVASVEVVELAEV